MTNVISTVDYLTPAPWIGERSERFEFNLLDKDLFLIGSLTPTEEANPSITASTDRAICRTLEGIELVLGELDRINRLADRIQPVMVMPDGTRIPMGVYVFGECKESRFGTVDVCDVSFMDQGWILDQPLERSVSIDAGGSCLDLVYTLATEVGIRSVQIATDIPSPTAAEPVAWAAGTSRISAMTDLCTKMGCVRPYFDNVGVLRITRAPTGTSTVSFEIAENQLIADSLLTTDDSYQAPNRYIAIGTGSTTPIVGTYNVPDQAPHSFANRGFVVAHTIDAPGVADTFAATEAARAAAVTDSRSYTTVSFSTLIDPRHDLFNVIQWDDQVWLEVEQRIALQYGGGHDHTLARLW